MLTKSWWTCSCESTVTMFVCYVEFSLQCSSKKRNPKNCRVAQHWAQKVFQNNFSKTLSILSPLPLSVYYRVYLNIIKLILISIF